MPRSRAKVILDGAQSIVASKASSRLQSYGKERKLQIVMDHKYLLWIEGEEPLCRTDTPSALVHECHWFEKHDGGSSDTQFSPRSVELLLPSDCADVVLKRITEHPTAVVPASGVLGSFIAKEGDEPYHGCIIRVSCCGSK